VNAHSLNRWHNGSFEPAPQEMGPRMSALHVLVRVWTYLYTFALELLNGRVTHEEVLLAGLVQRIRDVRLGPDGC
jgi:hypothetical protein